MAATCHKIMGDTLTEACTKVSAIDSMYRVWQSEQIYVIVSRVKSLSTLTFVGSESDTLAAIKSVLTKRKENDLLMSAFYRQISVRVKSRLQCIDFAEGVF